MNSEILDIARDLGKSIRDSDLFNDYLMKEEKYHSDSDAMELQKKLETNNSLYRRYVINKETDKLKDIKMEIDKLNKLLDSNDSYIEYNNAKDKLDKLLSNIDNIIEFYTGLSSESGCSSCSKKCNK